MQPVSAYSTVGATSKSGPLATDRLATVAARVRTRVEAVRLAIHNNSPKGFQQRLSEVMGWRKERPSREQTGVEKLSVDLVLAEVEMHEAEGRPEAATKILAPFQRRQTPVIRMRDGQYYLEFE